jgi:hypothetical protein
VVGCLQVLLLYRELCADEIEDWVVDPDVVNDLRGEVEIRSFYCLDAMMASALKSARDYRRIAS